MTAQGIALPNGIQTRREMPVVIRSPTRVPMYIETHATLKSPVSVHGRHHSDRPYTAENFFVT